MSERQWVNKKCELKFHRDETRRPTPKEWIHEGMQEMWRGNSEKGVSKEREVSEVVKGSVKPLLSR